MIDRYETMRRAKGGKGMKSLDAALRTVRNNLGDHLKLPAKQFSKADLRSVRDAIHKRAPQQASRFLRLSRPGLALGGAGGPRRHQFRAGRAEDRQHPEAREDARATTRSPRIWHASFKLDKGDASQRVRRNWCGSCC